MPFRTIEVGDLEEGTLMLYNSQEFKVVDHDDFAEVPCTWVVSQTTGERIELDSTTLVTAWRDDEESDEPEPESAGAPNNERERFIRAIRKLEYEGGVHSLATYGNVFAEGDPLFLAAEMYIAAHQRFEELIGHEARRLKVELEDGLVVSEEE